MKEIFIKYRSVIRFVALFLGSYFLLSLIYSFYIKSSVTSSYYPDFFTHQVARQAAGILELLGFAPVLTEMPVHSGMYITIKQTYSVNIVEGCNAISVIILFVSFVLSFAEDLKKTAFFILIGILLIYLVNVLRIAILAIALYKYPEHQEFLHEVLFPAIIYGLVFLLWLYWVKNIKPKVSDE